MQVPRPLPAFSLLEVLIAIGVFGFSVMFILGLIPVLAREAARGADQLTAQRLPDALKLELQRLAAGDLDRLAARFGETSAISAPRSIFVASRDGARLQLLDAPAPPDGEVPEGQRYFVIECRRFSDDALRYDRSKRFLALTARVTWPYRPDDGARAMQSEFVFTVCLNL